MIDNLSLCDERSIATMITMDITATARSAWSRVRPGYLDACTVGIATTATRDAMHDAVTEWASGDADLALYAEAVDGSRAAFAALMGVPPEQVSIGSTVADLVATVAGSLPDGAEVVCVDGDFSSIVFPFLQQEPRGIRVRHVAAQALADAIRPGTALVSFSIVQSADGSIIDPGPVLAAAARVGALVLCDTTQAAGIMPVDAGRFDITVCHAYKWLCAPRGAAFMTLSYAAELVIRPLHAGWYAGEDIWASCYGPTMQLAPDARRFDTSPAWLSWVGAREALEFMAALDTAAVWSQCSALADHLLDRLALPRLGRPIITLDDADGSRAASLIHHGVRASTRAGRVRLGFHLWNTEDDVDLVVSAISSARTRTST